ncbi:MAG: SMP-30/gluconolactonase/LRE family protein [Planctomycetota bacterium]|nr:SMP-30/gluconolactonase/LRE family protein [Planctomycetota bacterium]
MRRVGYFFSVALVVLSLGAAEVLDQKAGVRKVAGGCKFTEGPAVSPGGELFFSDIENNRIMKVAGSGKVQEFRRPSGRANGIVFDSRGRLVMCQGGGPGGGRRVARLEKDGRETVLAETYAGKKFIAPNDLCIDGLGRIFFTDPYYGPPAVKSQPSSGVYLITAEGKVQLLLKDLLKPNGIALSPDGRHLYISDRGTQKLHRYRVEEDGSLAGRKIIYDFSPDRGIDGMCLDTKGNIYGAAGKGKTTGLFVISPAGKLLLHRPMPEFSTNVSFGGKDGRDLYLTASSSVYKMRSTEVGLAWPARTLRGRAGKAGRD